MEAMRFFNTEGPVRAEDHYCIPPLERIDLDAVLELVRGKHCFVLHAPRQTGKTQRFDQYREAGPQLLLQAYLQKVVNGDGRVEREYALGRGRVDLLLLWPHGGRERRFVVECKVRRGALERTIRAGVEQTRSYVDRCRAESGHLIVFDRSEARTWEEKIFRREAPAATGGAPVTVWGM